MSRSRPVPCWAVGKRGAPYQPVVQAVAGLWSTASAAACGLSPSAGPPGPNASTRAGTRGAPPWPELVRPGALAPAEEAPAEEAPAEEAPAEEAPAEEAPAEEAPEEEAPEEEAPEEEAPEGPRPE